MPAVVCRRDAFPRRDDSGDDVARLHVDRLARRAVWPSVVRGRPSIANGCAVDATRGRYDTPAAAAPAVGATIDGDSSSLIATGSTVVSPYRRSTVVRGSIASMVNVIESALAAGNVIVLRPCSSGAGTSTGVD